jgi:hypothetical protein
MAEWRNGRMAEWWNGRMVFYSIPNLSCYIYGTHRRRQQQRRQRRQHQRLLNHLIYPKYKLSKINHVKYTRMLSSLTKCHTQD